MEPLSVLLTFVWGIPLSLMDSLHKGPVIQTFDVGLKKSIEQTVRVTNDMKYHDVHVTQS